MKRVVIVLAAVSTLAVAAVATSAVATEEPVLHGRLTGFQEVPAISTTGHGSFTATMRADGVHYRLSYSGMQGTVLFAHIHFGRRATNGGIAVFLCGGEGAPDCPPGPSGTVTGVFTAADVIGPSAQGIDPGQARELMRAAAAHATYANVHTEPFPSGEIRGQLALSD